MKTHPASILAAAILSFGATPATGEPLNEINDRTTLSRVCAQTFASLASFAACSCAKLQEHLRWKSSLREKKGLRPKASGTKRDLPERWPSGRRRSPAKGVDGQPSRGFESLPLRHISYYVFVFWGKFSRLPFRSSFRPSSDQGILGLAVRSRYFASSSCGVLPNVLPERVRVFRLLSR